MPLYLNPLKCLSKEKYVQAPPEGKAERVPQLCHHRKGPCSHSSDSVKGSTCPKIAADDCREQARTYWTSTLAQIPWFQAIKRFKGRNKLLELCSEVNQLPVLHKKITELRTNFSPPALTRKPGFSRLSLFCPAWCSYPTFSIMSLTWIEAQSKNSWILFQSMLVQSQTSIFGFGNKKRISF